ncbi:MAG TPA: copper homeostasis membrane protein CopD [Hyphomicrobiaceae bacterium]|nr:copper homeostasis membrane protein CopD [Hyphomicrobiaceae bacterium]
METAFSLARFLHYSAAIQLFGMAIFETWIAPEALSSSLLGTSRRIAIFNAWLLLASAAAWLALEAGTMGNGWGDVVNPGTIWLVITATGFGQVWVFNLILAVIAVLIAHLLGPRRWAALAIAATLCLAGLAFIGHAVDGTGTWGLLSEASQVIHLLSSGFWFGSLLSLVLVLRQIRDPRYTAETDIALRRFSGLGHAAVALALASGLANSWFVLRDSPLTLASTYQLLLALKVALVGTMCLLALVNRYVFMPAIPAGDPGARRLRDGTIAELIVGTGVIALVSVIGLLSPS